MDHCSGCCLAIILIPLLCIALVACVVIYIVTNAPDAPLSGHFSPSPAEAQALDSEITRATNQASAQGWFSLKFTERELSSWMALKGQDYADEHGYSFPFKDAQVGLSGGSMKFYGKLKYGKLSVPILVTVKPKVDSSGQMAFDITSVDFGGVKTPDFVLKNVTRQFKDVLFKQLDNLPGSYYLYQETLDVNNGTFAVQGQIIN